MSQGKPTFTFSSGVESEEEYEDNPIVEEEYDEMYPEDVYPTPSPGFPEEGSSYYSPLVVAFSPEERGSKRAAEEEIGPKHTKRRRVDYTTEENIIQDKIRKYNPSMLSIAVIEFCNAFKLNYLDVTDPGKHLFFLSSEIQKIFDKFWNGMQLNETLILNGITVNYKLYQEIWMKIFDFWEKVVNSIQEYSENIKVFNIDENVVDVEEMNWESENTFFDFVLRFFYSDIVAKEEGDDAGEAFGSLHYLHRVLSVTVSDFKYFYENKDDILNEIFASNLRDMPDREEVVQLMDVFWDPFENWLMNIHPGSEKNNVDYLLDIWKENLKKVWNVSEEINMENLTNEFKKFINDRMFFYFFLKK